MVLNETRQNLEDERISDGEIKECFRDVLGSDFGITIRNINCHSINGTGPHVAFEVGLDGSKYEDDILATVYRRYTGVEPETTIFLGSVLAGEGSYWESHTIEEFEHDLTDLIKTAQVAGNIKDGKVVLNESSDIVRKRLEAAVAAAKDMEPLKEFKVSHNIISGEGELTTVLRDLEFVGEIEKELGKGEWTVWFKDSEAYLDLKVNYSTGKYRFELYKMASSEGKWAGVSIEEFVHDVKEAYASVYGKLSEASIRPGNIKDFLKAAASKFGARYSSGWWGYGITEGEGTWQGGEWAVLYDEDHGELIFKKSTNSFGISPMGLTRDKADYSVSANKILTVEDVVNFINKGLENAGAREHDEADRKNAVEKALNDACERYSVVCEDFYEAKHDVYIAELDTEDSGAAEDIENAVKSAYETATVYMRDYSDISEDRYEDLDPDVRDKKVIVIRFD